ncbi:hypothetical protein BC943DRAFT_323720 [Umbelopsis sp. AD052]|nr:hypothetical protein BC943DRAFT_323720 [Umbelopsis sp. AD052]
MMRLQRSSCTPPTTWSNSTLYQDSCNSSMLSCDPDSNSCQWRSCTILGITLGWDNATHNPPTSCNSTTYCPNSQLSCHPLLAIGSACDTGRDDECSGTLSICLNSVCSGKTAQLNQICSTESISSGGPFISSVYDNCTSGTYCSALNGVGICQSTLSSGQGCLQDRQCESQKCQNGHCLSNKSANNTLPAWQWAIVGCILFIFVITSIGIFLVLRRRRQLQNLGDLHFDDPAAAKSFYQRQLAGWKRSREQQVNNVHQDEKPVPALDEVYPYWHTNHTTESYDNSITPTPSAFPIPPEGNLASRAIEKVNIRLSGTFTPTFGGSHHRKSKSPITPIPSPTIAYPIVDDDQEMKIWQAVRSETPPWPVQGKGWKFARAAK